MQEPTAGRLAGQSLGGYLLHDILGFGGMAEVYQGTDLTLEREVAVKVLSATLAANADYVRRFHDEAKQVAALNHPHVVPIYAFGEERGYFYHVMPMLHGSLRDRLRLDGHLLPDEAVRLVGEIASALGAAHAMGLVHRDVKPENILLDAEGSALLTDFGIARELAALGQEGVVWTLAHTGLPIGTPQYMSPEQLRAEPCDQRADIYSLGAVLYELLTGEAPHEASSPFEAAALVLSAPIVPPSKRNQQVWPALEQVVQKALAFDRANRYPDMQSFAAALELALLLPRTVVPVPPTILPPVAGSSRRRRMGLPQLIPLLRTRLQRPRARFAALALLLIVAVLGTGVVALRAAGIGATSPSGGGVPGAFAKATASAPAALATTTALSHPTTTPRATKTLVPSPSPTPVLLPSPTPSPTLVIQPKPLVLKPSSQNPNMCVATQTITNTTGRTVGWQWQQPQAGGFHFQINGGPMMDWPKDLQPGIAPGRTDTITATSNCQPQSLVFGILLTDSPGDQYTFVLKLE
jgi:serine/threonine protein kinase